MSVKELQEMMDKQHAEFQAMRESYQADLAHTQQQLLAAQGHQDSAAADYQEISPEVGSVAIRLPSFCTTALSFGLLKWKQATIIGIRRSLLICLNTIIFFRP